MIPRSQAATTSDPIRGRTATRIPGMNLDDADGVHQRLRRQVQGIRNYRCEVAGPVGQEVGELVQAEQDGGDGEHGAQ